MTKEEFTKLIGMRIKELRINQKVSQRQLALQANKDPQSLERVENGKSCPTVFYLKEVCDALNIDLVRFFDESNVLSSSKKFIKE